MAKFRKKKNETDEEFNIRVSKYYYEHGYTIEEINIYIGIPIIEVYNAVTNGRVTTDKEREEMISMHKSGYSIYEIAKRFNKSSVCIKERLKSPAKVAYFSGNILSKDKLDIMEKMINNGDDMHTIANAIGITENSIKNRISHTNSKPTKSLNNDEIKNIINLYNSGLSYTSIACKLNRSRCTIIRHIKKYKEIYEK